MQHTQEGELEVNDGGQTKMEKIQHHKDADDVMSLDERVRDLLPDEDDLVYEEELLRNPYNLKLWLRYIESRREGAMKKRYVLYERALQAMPGSYKVRCVVVCLAGGGVFGWWWCVWLVVVCLAGGGGGQDALNRVDAGFSLYDLLLP